MIPLSFVHPLFLLGLLGVAVPVYFHLYFRRTPVERDFPSLRLIRLSVSTLVRRMWLKNLLLLLLRISVVCLAVLALSRPFWGSFGGVTAQIGAPSAFVVILDNSMSMGLNIHGISLFNEAKTRALELLDRMNPSDKGSLVLLNDPGDVLFPQLTWDRDELRAAVKNTSCKVSGTNILQSMQAAVKLLDPVKSYKRTIYLITDLTHVSWKPFLQAFDLNRVDPTIDLVLVPALGEDVPNLGISQLTLGVPSAWKGRSAPIALTVANHSSAPQKTLVSLFLDDEKKTEMAIEIPARSRKPLTMKLPFPQAGIARIRAELSGDALAADDVRHLAVRVLDPQKVLIVRPPPGRDGAMGREETFLKFALNPLSRGDAAFAVDVRMPTELVGVSFDAYRAVILTNLRQFPEPLLGKLTDYVFSGGNLVVFMGSLIDPNWYNLNLIDRPGARYLLPGRVVKRIGNSVSKTIQFQLSDLDFSHSAFRLFAGEGNGDPGIARVFEYYQVEINPTARVLARMSHGFPAILEESRGLGRTMLVTFTSDTEWTDWPLKATFLPFIHQCLLGMIGGGEGNGAVNAGAAYSTVLPGDSRSIALQLPSGQIEEVSSRNEGAGFIPISVTNTLQTGVYMLTWETPAGKKTEAFTVNPPVDEGDLSRMELAKIPRFIPLQAGKSRSTFGDKVDRVKLGTEWSYPLLILLLALALAETYLANRPSSTRRELASGGPS